MSEPVILTFPILNLNENNRVPFLIIFILEEEIPKVLKVSLVLLITLPDLLRSAIETQLIPLPKFSGFFLAGVLPTLIFTTSVNNIIP
jgi:hypothetical protein